MTGVALIIAFVLAIIVMIVAISKFKVVAGRGPAHGGQCGCICKGRTGERQIPL